MPTASARTAKRRSAKKKPVTPEDLLELIFVSDPQMAPDGSAILYVRKNAGEKNNDVRNLWMVSTAGDEEPRQFTSGERDTHPRFSHDGRRVAFVRSNEEGAAQLYTMPTTGGEARALTTFPEGSIGSFAWSPDDATLAVSFRTCDPEWTTDAKAERKKNGRSDPPRVLDHWWYRLDGDGYFNGQRFHLHLVDAATGADRVVYTKDTLGFFTFDFSPDSTQLVIATNRDRAAGLRAWSDELLRLKVSTGKLTPIANLPDGPKSAPRWSPDGRLIAYAGRAGQDDSYSTENLELWTCDPARGAPRCLSKKTDYCLLAATLTDTSGAAFDPWLRWAPDAKRVYARIGWHGESHLVSFTRTGAERIHTRGAFLHAPGSLSRDGRRMALTVSSMTRPDEIHVATLGKNGVDLATLTNHNGPLLKDRVLARPKSHWVESADGTTVHTWVMLPPATPKSRALPAVLEIHGGPHAQYGCGFFHEMQMLSSAGYAVFFSNPRGSKGYGRDHCRAIRGAWGTADWVDIQAVTAFMKRHPNVDEKRMAVMGGSYGGYMTNWVIGNCRDFAAAITDRCVSNLVSMSGNSDYVDVPDIYWDGNAWDRPEARWFSSPIRFMSKVRTPTLIIHSEGDLRCNIEQAEQVFTALSLRRIPTRFVRYPRTTSHGMSRGGPPDMRVHRLHQILGWLNKHLKKR